jgi:NarL family two-component system response regulator YdfI
MIMERIRILVVDDHPIVREGLKLIFETEEQFEIADEAANGKEALMLMKINKYDLILLDIRMPIMDGLDFLLEKEKLGDETLVVVLTTADDRETINTVLSHGVKSFMLKDSSRDEMFRTVQAALKDEVYISAEVTYILQNRNTEKNDIEEIIGYGLTEREILVLKSVVRGATSKEIAIDMGVTERTVKAHLTNIYRKLDVNSRSEAVAVAVSKKIVVV